MAAGICASDAVTIVVVVIVASTTGGRIGAAGGTVATAGLKGEKGNCQHLEQQAFTADLLGFHRTITRLFVNVTWVAHESPMQLT